VKVGECIADRSFVKAFIRRFFHTDPGGISILECAELMQEARTLLRIESGKGAAESPFEWFERNLVK